MLAQIFETIAPAMEVIKSFLTMEAAKRFLTATNIAPFYMAIISAYDCNEKILAEEYHASHQPTLLQDNPIVSTGDVSIIVPTIDTEDTFTDSVRLWLANKPKEIIIVTIPRDLSRVQQLVQPIPRPEADKIRILTVPRPNKRVQLIRGIKYATGSVLALVDDDVFWPHHQVLPHLLAPLKGAEIGAVGGPQKPHLPEYRQDINVITPWEAAALRAFESHSKYSSVRMGADGGIWCLVGRTVIVRTEILQDEDFYDFFANETWFGNKLNTGDDVSITRWIQHIAGWDITFQNCPEATVTTTIKRDSGFAKQMIRWQRSTLMMLFTHLFTQPGFSELSETHPYMARKMVERLLRPLIDYLYIVAWVVMSISHPIYGFLALLCHLYTKYKTYRDFLRRFPYCRKQLWAVIAVDHNAYVLAPYTWLTMANDEWLTRNDSATRRRG